MTVTRHGAARDDADRGPKDHVTREMTVLMEPRRSDVGCNHVRWNRSAPPEDGVPAPSRTRTCRPNAPTGTSSARCHQDAPAASCISTLASVLRQRPATGSSPCRHARPSADLSIDPRRRRLPRFRATSGSRRRWRRRWWTGWLLNDLAGESGCARHIDQRILCAHRQGRATAEQSDRAHDSHPHVHLT